MSRRPDPLPSDILTLLERTRPGTEPPSAVRAELRARLGPALSLPLSMPPTTPPLGRLAHGVARALSKKAPLAMLSFGLGAGTGAAVAVRAMRAPSNAIVRAPAVITPEAALPPVATQSPVAPPVLAKPPPETHTRTQPARPAARPAPAALPAPAVARIETDPDRLLAAERVLIEKGRSALARGDAAGALAAVAEHAQTFPQGSLREESDALRIQALLGAGRKAEAAEAFTDFARRYPRSMLTPALHRALQ